VRASSRQTAELTVHKGHLVQSHVRWYVDPALASRIPALFCLGYCGLIFFLKAIAHTAFDIPHVDDVDEFVPRALALITLGLVPAMVIVLIAPVTRPVTGELPSPRQLRLLTNVCFAFSAGMVLSALFQRGGDALHDFYGNRVLIEHGIYAPLTIMFGPLLYATVTVLAISMERRAFLRVAILSGIWGVFFAKGFMLAYPLLIYVGLRGLGRRFSMLPALAIAVLGLAAVVLLGRLRAGGDSDISKVLDDDGLRLLLLLFLHRIDQLDSFALVISQHHLEGSTSLWAEIVSSVGYLLPRDAFPDKPLSFSMEMTKLFRPAVFQTDAANNFTIFSQMYLVAGELGFLLCFLCFLAFFYSMALLQRRFFSNVSGFWAFNLSVAIPCFLSLVGAGLFREYIIFQLILSLPGLFLFRHMTRRATPVG
jgi:hypothetical protein